MTDLRSQLQSTLGDAYTIERELGGGGMSRVFVATESALGRRVVVKVPSVDSASEISADRFKREVLVASRLHHPHIVPVLSAGQADGTPYFTMPYIEGDTLRTHLVRQGALPIADATRILREIAAALAHAHEHGVVHRDVKPENVLVSGGSAMVSDFGIAKAIAVSTTQTADGLTGPGAALGTPAYMAPEQATGDPSIDHRADIYAWGVVAYELLTGATPFAGRPAHAMIAAHLSAPVEPLETRRPETPLALAALVMRALEKDPAGRPQSAAELISALDSVSTPGQTAARGASRRAARTKMVWGIAAIAIVAMATWGVRARRSAATATPISIAIMPLDVVGPDSTTAFFAGALVDQLRGELVRSGLPIAPRGSTQALKDRKASTSDVVRELHVSGVVAGALERLGTRVRVTLELTDSTGFAIWNHIVEKEAATPFAVKDEIVRELSGALRDRFATQITILARAHVPDREAFDLYSRGVFWWRRGGPDDLAKARDYYRAAIHHDTLFVDAYNGLAQALIWLADAYESPLEVIPPALAAAKRAAELDDQSSEAHSMIGEMRWGYYHEWDAARVELERAIALDPNNSEPRLFMAWMAMTLGDRKRAVELARESMRQDPLDPLNALAGPAIMIWSGADDEGLAMYQHVRQEKILPENFFYLEAWESQAFRRKGQLDNALAADSAATRVLGHPTAGLVLTLVKLNRMDEARRAAQALSDVSHRHYLYPELVALGWLGVGDTEKAMDELERGAANLAGGISYTLNAFDEFRILKGNPRFERYLEKANLSAYFR